MLRESSIAEEGVLKVSKMLKLPVLLDLSELDALLQTLPPLLFYDCQGLCEKERGVYTKNDVLSRYTPYISALKKGEIPAKLACSFIMSGDASIIYSVSIDNTHHVIKANAPIIQFQPHCIQYSSFDHSFHSMAYGQEGISWGMLISYPQLYQNPKTSEVLDVDERFSNTEIFHLIRKWIRDYTLATPFVVEGKRINIPARLGKKCFEWIDKHAQLQERQLLIDKKPHLQ